MISDGPYVFTYADNGIVGQVDFSDVIVNGASNESSSNYLPVLIYVRAEVTFQRKSEDVMIDVTDVNIQGLQVYYNGHGDEEVLRRLPEDLRNACRAYNSDDIGDLGKHPYMFPVIRNIESMLVRYVTLKAPFHETNDIRKA